MRFREEKNEKKSQQKINEIFVFWEFLQFVKIFQMFWEKESININIKFSSK